MSPGRLHLASGRSARVPQALPGARRANGGTLAAPADACRSGTLRFVKATMNRE